MIAAPILLSAVDPQRRLRFVGGLAIAALLVVCLIAPFLRDQLAAVHARGGAQPIVVSPYSVFGGQFPGWLRHVLDVPGYWLIVLPVELPAAFIAGVIALGAALRGVMPPGEKLVIKVFACLAVASLVVSWLFVSTLGENNDLGLRAIIPAEVVLTVMTAAGIAGLRGESLRTPIMAAALAGLLLSAPDFILTIRDNIIAPRQPPDGKVFAAAPDLWAAVRRHTAPAARIANNPRFLADLTPWPVNMSWALLANRSSCFAGREWRLRLRRCRGSAAPRSTPSFCVCSMGTRHRTISMVWQRNSAVMWWCLCRRIGLGITTPLRGVPTIVWLKRAKVARGYM